MDRQTNGQTTVTLSAYSHLLDNLTGCLFQCSSLLLTLSEHVVIILYCRMQPHIYLSNDAGAGCVRSSELHQCVLIISRHHSVITMLLQYIGNALRVFIVCILRLYFANARFDMHCIATAIISSTCFEVTKNE